MSPKRPASLSWSSAPAVNDLVIEPMPKRVCGVTGVCVSRFAKPALKMRSTPFLSTIATDIPGAPCRAIATGANAAIASSVWASVGGGTAGAGVAPISASESRRQLEERELSMFLQIFGVEAGGTNAMDEVFEPVVEQDLARLGEFEVAK